MDWTVIKMVLYGLDINIITELKVILTEMTLVLRPSDSIQSLKHQCTWGTIGCLLTLVDTWKYLAQSCILLEG